MGRGLSGSGRGGPSCQLATLLGREKALTVERPSTVAAASETGLQLLERDREAAWLCSSAPRLRLSTDALCLAVSVFDRVVSITRVPTKYANCLATASLYIAKKLCEDGDESPSAFLESLDLGYSANELKRMELSVLGILGWDAFLPTAERFASAQLCVLGFEWAWPALRCPLEACLRRGSLCRSFPASLVAASVVSLVLERVSLLQWPLHCNLLLTACNLELSQLIRCRETIARVFCPSINPYSPLADDSSSQTGEAPASPSAPLLVPPSLAVSSTPSPSSNDLTSPVCVAPAQC